MYNRTILSHKLPSHHPASHWPLEVLSVPLTILNQKQGIWSGFQFVPESSESLEGYTVPEFTITINDTNPVWFYCAQVKHCQTGMVMAVNANSTVHPDFCSNWSLIGRLGRRSKPLNLRLPKPPKMLHQLSPLKGGRSLAPLDRSK